MSTFTPRGYELPEGTDPIASGDDVMRANWTLADGEFQDLADWRATFVFHRASATTSTSGFITVTPADVGLTTVVGAVASVDWVNASGNVHIASARINSNAIQVMIWESSSFTGGTMSRAVSTAVVCSIIAWGIA